MVRKWQLEMWETLGQILSGDQGVPDFAPAEAGPARARPEAQVGRQPPADARARARAGQARGAAWRTGQQPAG